MIEYPYGCDCLWLTCDREERVGAFITAGDAPIPLAALDSAKWKVEDMEGEVIRKMPRMTVAQVLVEVKRPDSYIELAERGLYVYDWLDAERIIYSEMYELVALPAKPVFLPALRDLLPGFTGLAEALQLKEVSFADAKKVDVRTYFPCMDSSRKDYIRIHGHDWAGTAPQEGKG